MNIIDSTIIVKNIFEFGLFTTCGTEFAVSTNDELTLPIESVILSIASLPSTFCIIPKFSIILNGKFNIISIIFRKNLTINTIKSNILPINANNGFKGDTNITKNSPIGLKIGLKQKMNQLG